MNAFFSSGVHGGPEVGVDARHLSKVWRISYEDAKGTIDATTQYGTHTPNRVMNQNYTTNDRMLRYRQITQYFFMNTFFATKKGVTSSRGNTCCQFFVTDKGFIYVVPMKRKSEVLAAIKLFAEEVGAPDAIVSDMAKEQVSQEVRNFCNTIGTTLRALEEGTPWSNKVELYIKLMKEGVCKDMKESNCPLRFCDYCLECRVRIYSLTSRDHIKVRGSNPHTETFGEQGDISNLCQFRWYLWCYFRDHKAPFPHNQEVLGCVLGPAQGEGNELSQWVLKSNGNVVPRRTVRATTDAEENENNDDEMTKRHIDIEDSVDSQGALINQLPAYDRQLNAEIMVQAEEGHVSGKVTKRVLGPDGKVAGKYDHVDIL